MRRDLGILSRQVRHELAALWRSPIVLVLAVAFPLFFFVLVAAVVGNETIDERSGIRVAQFMAPAFASFGVVMSCFSFLATGFAEARTDGVLKRQNGTPLPRWALLGGRMGAALLLGLTATLLIVGVGVIGYGVQVVGRTLASVVLTLVVASLAFAALGLAVAVLAPTPQATQAVTNGIVFPIAFVSDIFAIGGDVPRWMSTLGWVFPLKHLVNALGDAFNPFLPGSGFALDHLGVIAAWGLAGAVVAVVSLRREREVAPRGAERGRRERAADTAPRRTVRPGALALLRDQVAHTTTALRRDVSSVFFAVAFPVILVVVVPAMNGGRDATLTDGRRLAAFFAATMATYGAAVTGYVSMPELVARWRGLGVLKREHATPLPKAALLVGHAVGAVWVSFLTLVAVYLVAWVLFGVGVPIRWWAVLLSFLLASACFAALGLALASLIRTAQGVTGVALGTLLPLAFLSDIFLVGADLPQVIDRISWLFPLRHATRAMTLAAAPPDFAGSGLQVGHLVVILAWTVAASAVVAWRFGWEVSEPRRATSTGADAPGPALADVAR